MAATGGCLCGAVRYRVTAFAGDVYACHCTECRKQTGHHSAAVPVRAGDIAIEGAPRWHASSEETRRGFCPTCGSYLFWLGGDGTTWVMAGSLDGPTGLRLAAHIYYPEHGDYYRAADGLPCHERWIDSAEVAP